ncbi:hypothetical protein [Paenarthrobacter ureafaciens]|uniref:hypothetical protein n=1 Tax=Paenarthrobacter ureafaciens TaxID=37931 RepID=UPI001409C768|nr:hypothetical protein [Paenarthrobacter ureafaciens]MCX8454816.1 hypothetical protein [Paenarthrobacter ureafaciens]MCY0973622.1 hypothetical protein [Paenarthrobacter ureafaciens]
MTYRDRPSRESESTAAVDELLLEADLSDDADMRAVLLSLRTLGNLPAPAPGPELAAMLARPHDQLAKRRWQRKHRAALAGVAVVAAMGLGVSGVAAASSGFTKTPTIISGIFGNPSRQGDAAPQELPRPDAPRVITEPAPTEENVPGGSLAGSGGSSSPSALPEAPRTTAPQQSTAPTQAAPEQAAPEQARADRAPDDQAQGTIPGSKDLPAVANQAAKDAHNSKVDQGAGTSQKGKSADARWTAPGIIGKPGKTPGVDIANPWGTAEKLLRQAPAVSRK